MRNLAVIVLAAGMGTRMKSRKPKVLHAVAGRSMLGHVLALAGALEPERVVVVHGPGEEGAAVAEEARRWLPGVALAEQAERKGTGHAVMQAMPALEDFDGRVLVLYGDVPLLTHGTLEALLAKAEEAPLAVLGFEAADPAGYGRLILSQNGGVDAIVEEKDATEEQRRITLCNSGVMAAEAGLLRRLLPELSDENAQGELYLTDLVALSRAEGARVALATCAEEETLGVNDRAQLARAERVMQRRLRAAAMRNGATFTDPESVFLSFDTQLGRDVTVGPFVVFGPGCAVADGATIHSHCHLEGAVVEEGAQIGPFARLRPGARIRAGAKVGNFVEIKNATVEAGAKVNHLSYIGDATVGAKANIGAGTITCNYDGFLKHRTEIGAGAFIGSNTALVAPVKIGAGALVAAGSTITKDVPEDALAIERAEERIVEGWAAHYRERKRREKERRQAAAKRPENAGK